MSEFVQKRVEANYSFRGQLVRRRKDSPPHSNIFVSRVKGKKVGTGSTRSSATREGDSGEEKERIGKESGRCPTCRGAHPLYKCDFFLALTPDDRWNKVSEQALCFNCLGNHFA